MMSLCSGDRTRSRVGLGSSNKPAWDLWGSTEQILRSSHADEIELKQGNRWILQFSELQHAGTNLGYRYLARGK